MCTRRCARGQRLERVTPRDDAAATSTCRALLVACALSLAAAQCPTTHCDRFESLRMFINTAVADASVGAAGAPFLNFVAGGAYYYGLVNATQSGGFGLYRFEGDVYQAHLAPPVL